MMSGRLARRVRIEPRARPRPLTTSMASGRIAKGRMSAPGSWDPLAGSLDALPRDAEFGIM